MINNPVTNICINKVGLVHIKLDMIIPINRSNISVDRVSAYILQQYSDYPLSSVLHSSSFPTFHADSIRTVTGKRQAQRVKLVRALLPFPFVHLLYVHTVALVPYDRRLG